MLGGPLVPANAIVDTIEESTLLKIGKYKVKVYGAVPPFLNHSRVYEITAPSDGDAARACIGVFVREIQRKLLN